MNAYSFNNDYIPVQYGWKYMLFGVLTGTVNYLAGNVAKNLVDDVFLSIGFTNYHMDNDDLNKVTKKAVVAPNGVSTSTTIETYKKTVFDYDYAKLIKL